MKRLRSLILNASILILSALLFAGSFGLSYQVHYCCGHRHGVAFYPELGLQNPATCGCSDFSKEDNGISELTSGSCCKDETYYNRLIPEFSQNHTYRCPEVIFTNLDCLLLSFSSISNEEEMPVAAPYFRPPPLAGRQLVLFLSQQRIPHEIYG